MTKLPEIVGVAGTNGSGKDTLAELRAALQGSTNTSLSDMLRLELDARKLPHEREYLRSVGNELRAEFGPGVLATRAIDAYRASGSHNGVSLTSVRSIGEAEEIKAEGGVIVWIDADPKIRYDRVMARMGDRPSDKKTFEQFVEEEQVEMHPPEGKEDDKGVPNMIAVKAMADITVINEFASKEAYQDYLKTDFELNV
jgi:dephospho-CoA kinase